MDDVDPHAKTLFDKAVKEYKEGNMEAARTHAGAAWRKDRAILSLDDQGMVDAFEKRARGKIAKSPDDATNYYRLAKLQAIRGMPEEAATLLKKVAELAEGTALGRKATTLLGGLDENLAEAEYIEEDRKEYIKEARDEATIENIKLSNKEMAETNARLKREATRESKSTAQNNSKAQANKIKELEEENEQNELYKNMFWGRPGR